MRYLGKIIYTQPSVSTSKADPNKFAKNKAKGVQTSQTREVAIQSSRSIGDPHGSWNRSIFQTCIQNVKYLYKGRRDQNKDLKGETCVRLQEKPNLRI